MNDHEIQTVLNDQEAMVLIDCLSFTVTNAELPVLDSAIIDGLLEKMRDIVRQIRWRELAPDASQNDHSESVDRLFHDKGTKGEG